MASIGTEPQRCGEKRVDIDIMEDQRRYTELIGAWNETWASKIGQPRRVCVQTFGCQQNEADSERLRGMAHAMGYTDAETPEDADLILVNTCAVRDHAEKRALSVTGQFKHLKAQRSELLIGVCGCMVSQKHREEDIKKRYPYVDFLVGTTALYRFPEVLYKRISTGKRQFCRAGDERVIAEGIPVARADETRAWVSIMYGCNNFCTYCIVPYVRGRERSRRPEAVLDEVTGLVAGGYREITLLGQNVNSYGKDLPEPMEFAALLEKICEIPGEFSVRFMTSHPKDASRRLVDVMAEQKKISRQFHLPVQSGSNRILAAMNRHYTREDYLALVEYLRFKIPEVILTTDIIVGFPGETEEDLEETLRLLRTVRFDMIFSFQYSPRSGTPAAKMANQVAKAVKAERFQRLLETQNEISYEINQKYLGKRLSVLVEGESKHERTMFTGRTEGNKIVHFPALPGTEGTLIEVEITRAETFVLYGEAVSVGSKS